MALILTYRRFKGKTVVLASQKGTLVNLAKMVANHSIKLENHEKVMCFDYVIMYPVGWGRILNNAKIIRAAKSLPNALTVLVDHTSEATQLKKQAHAYVALIQKNRMKPKTKSKTLFVSSNLSLAKGNPKTIPYFNSLLYSCTISSKIPRATIHPPNQMRFLLLGGFPRASKTLVLASACLRGWLDNTFFCWSAGRITDVLPSYCLETTQKNLAKGMVQLRAKLPRYIDISSDNKKLTKPMMFNPRLYAMGRFHIVLETEITNGSVIRVTEKTFKCFLARVPFVVFGNPRTLQLLRSMGFKTFHPIINEKYDQIMDPLERVDCLLKEIDRWVLMTESEFTEKLNAVRWIVAFNYRVAIRLSTHVHYLNNLFNRLSKQLRA